ncbi:unnamed protein product, partial [Medioppia subpectinata]
MKLPGFRAPGVVDTNNDQFCDLQYSQSPGIRCNPSYRYRRFDGKCNNERQTNWGAAFHTMRRLLPPAFADGVNAERRRAADGRQPLLNERLISNQLSATRPQIDQKDKLVRSSTHMIWGQMIAHDTIKALQYFGGALPCCPPSQHPECPSVYTPVPSDQLLLVYNQTCIAYSRSMAGNTCRLGARDQITATTPVMDLSDLYGFFDARARSLRTFSGGKLQTNKSTKGDDIMPEAILPRDQDMFDLNPCTPPADRPWLGCLKGGDGNRVNQQVVINTMLTTLLLRHNQHCDGLALINQHWTDEILYQEARRLLLAEYAQITYAEYLPSTFNKKFMDFFDLNVRPRGKFSEYNPDVSPDTVQEYGIAAFRFGHSNINSVFPVLNGDPLNTSSFLLRFNFEQMSQLWDGNRKGIIKGLCEKFEKVTEFHYVDDVRDYVFFDPAHPRVDDLFNRDIFRARDHGLAPYVYYVQYCTGRHIKRWSDLQPLIPIDILNELRNVYKDFRDIDLIVGGLAETVMESSTLGPTLGCINGIQFHHFKFGDRFFYEHSSQAGSFSIGLPTGQETVGNIADITDRDIRVAIEVAIQGVNSQRQLDRQLVAQIPYKYRRIDGKCNNERQTNWGAAFHTMRRLLPPAFADGVNAERRRAIDGRQPLPNERLISNQLSAPHRHTVPHDRRRSSMHMIWGQVMAHDTIKSLQYFGDELPCCRIPQHPECPSVYTPVPSDPLLQAYNQTCIVDSRSIAGNTCRLGARDQITATTPVMDLSQLYGFFDARARSLRTFSKGRKLQTNKSLKGDDIMPEAILPRDQDILDLNRCTPPVDRPWLGCMKGGDGNRVNQQVVVTSMLTTLLLRHNQHCDGLALINQHWTDEILYQEARRLLLAEYAQITYAEYLPSVFNQKFMDFFDLNVRPYGEFSEYNPDVSPDTVQEYGAGAFRFGHSNIDSIFPVLNGNPLNSSAFKLRFNFEQMSELWDGNRRGIIKGLCEKHEKVTELHYVDDVRNYVVFNPSEPSVTDLFHRDIFRARDHGLAPYVYYVQYCTGRHIKRWSDLQPLIPIDILNELRDVYNGFDLIQLNAMYIPSDDNPRIPCDHFPDIDYRLWSEGVDDCDDFCQTNRINSGISDGIIPGLLTGAPKGEFDYTKEYSPELSRIYGQYLTDTVFPGNCTPETTGTIADITDRDIQIAIEAAIQGVNSQRQLDRQLIANNSFLGNFSHFLTDANYKTKFNEIVTITLTQIKCLSKYDTVMELPGVRMPGVSDTDGGQYCDLQYAQSPGIRCNPSYKYRRIDGKCNNERQTNWGAAFHTFRRLLPPAFADGVNAERRRAIDG